ncbi:hypothetical protein NSTCB13_06749 [Nostoc sp. DSM 114160]|jgi:hypothetical protein
MCVHGSLPGEGSKKLPYSLLLPLLTQTLRTHLLRRTQLLFRRTHLLIWRTQLLFWRTHLLIWRTQLLFWRTHLLIWRTHLLFWRTHLLFRRTHLLFRRCLRLATPTYLLIAFILKQLKKQIPLSGITTQNLSLFRSKKDKLEP